MIDQQLEKNYVIARLRKDLPVLMENWTSRSEDFRNQADAILDRSYGSDLREKIDIFPGGKSNAPLFVYFHGGYWQRGDKTIYSFIAKPFVENGVDVAIVGYPLCPQVSLTKLVGSVRQSLVFLFDRAKDLNISPDRFNICGNSAGGHLVAMMLATTWPEINKKLPADLIKFGAPLSALYELEPLRHTSLNDAIRLNAAEAKSNSPCFIRPVSNASILAAVGGDETIAFFDQMKSFIRRWQSEGAEVEQYIEENADHFDMIEILGDSNSGLCRQILSRLR